MELILSVCWCCGGTFSSVKAQRSLEKDLSLCSACSARSEGQERLQGAELGQSPFTLPTLLLLSQSCPGLVQPHNLTNLLQGPEPFQR